MECGGSGGGGGGGYFGGGGGGAGNMQPGAGGPGGGGGGGNGFAVAGATNVSMASGLRTGGGQVSVSYMAQAVARQDLAGERVRDASGPAIYLIDEDGTKRWIPDTATYNNLFRDWSGIQVVDVSTIVSGPQITSGAYLAIAQETMKTVYLVDNGHKRGITSPAVMDKFWFNWSQVKPVPQSLLDGLPDGPILN
jgi:hypothetical protein